MKRSINYLGFLSLLALPAALGWWTGNKSLYAFIGFAYYLRYFWVLPDEFFRQNVQRAATSAFMAEMLSLALFLFLFTYPYRSGGGIPSAFGLSFAVAILTFSVVLAALEHRESRGCE